jgi:hypothetical protein
MAHVEPLADVGMRLVEPGAPGRLAASLSQLGSKPRGRRYREPAERVDLLGRRPIIASNRRTVLLIVTRSRTVSSNRPSEASRPWHRTPTSLNPSPHVMRRAIASTSSGPVAAEDPAALSEASSPAPQGGGGTERGRWPACPTWRACRPDGRARPFERAADRDEVLGLIMLDPRVILSQASQGAAPSGWAVFATRRGRIRRFPRRHLG